MVMAPTLQVRQAVEAAACLCGERDERLPSTGSGESEEARLALRLTQRLEAYKTIAGDVGNHEAKVRLLSNDTQEQTGYCALQALLLLHDAVRQERVSRASQSSTSSDSAPILGSRDLRTLQTLLSILNNWGFGIKLAALDTRLAALQKKDEVQDKIVELPSEDVVIKEREMNILQYFEICKESASLLETSKTIMGVHGGKSEISNAFLHICTPQVISISIRLAYSPLLRRDDMEVRKRRQSAQELLHSTLRFLSTSSCLQVLSAASQNRSASQSRKSGRKAPAIPSFVKAAIERLYSAQLLRVDGVLALLKISFSNDADDGTSDLNKKLARVGHLLTTPPPNMRMEDFASVVVPRLLEIVGEMPEGMVAKGHEKLFLQSSGGQKTAACFALGRLFDILPQIVEKVLESHLWTYLKPVRADNNSSRSSLPLGDVERTIMSLTQLVEHSEPASAFLNTLIAPISIPLFTLSAFLKNYKKRNITEVRFDQGQDLFTMVASLLKTYLRTAPEEELIKLFSPHNRSGLFATTGTSVGAIDESSSEPLHPFWDRSEGRVAIAWRPIDSVSEMMNILSSLQTNDMGPVSLTESGDSQDISSELLSRLSVSPSATLLSSLLKETSRKDIAAQILSDLLEAYTLTKQEETSLVQSSSGSSRSVVYIQHILELIKVFGEDVLGGQLDRVLRFINFSLGGQAQREAGEGPVEVDARGSGGALDNLMNVSRSTDDGGLNRAQPAESQDLELVETALNLLLSLMEGNAELNVESHSILKIIAMQVDGIASACSDADVRSLAREARLVLTARRSTTFASANFAHNDANGESPLKKAYAKGNAKYQEALRLLQDPILPVRAHGLIMLKELASFGSSDVTQATLMDPALTNAILDIYLQAVEDDESFLYLNAVKGLAEMANAGGRSMVRRIVSIYLSPAPQGRYTKQLVDKQLRMGEALLQVVQKLEEALSAYLEDIVDPLMTALRDRQRPTTLRASYLSLLGTCVEASPTGMASSASSGTIVDGMLDLLTVETSPRKSFVKEEVDDAMQDPTHLDPKLPQLRRAAVLLLALFIRGSRHQVEAAQRKKDEIESEREDGHLTALRLPNGNILGGAMSGKQSSPTSLSLLFPDSKTSRTKSILTYLAQTDSDDLVRHQSSELLQELDELTLTRYTQ